MTTRYRVDQVMNAVGLSLVGLAVAALIVLRATDPRRVAKPVNR